MPRFDEKSDRIYTLQHRIVVLERRHKRTKLAVEWTVMLSLLFVAINFMYYAATFIGDLIGFDSLGSLAAVGVLILGVLGAGVVILAFEISTEIAQEKIEEFFTDWWNSLIPPVYRELRQAQGTA